RVSEPERVDGVGEALVYVDLERAVEFVAGHAELLVEQRLAVAPLAVALQHGGDGPDTGALLDVLDQQRAEEVGVHHLVRVGRAYEGLVEPAHRQQAVPGPGLKETGADVGAPAGPGEALLDHGQALGE